MHFKALSVLFYIEVYTAPMMMLWNLLVGRKLPI